MRTLGNIAKEGDKMGMQSVAVYTWPFWAPPWFVFRQLWIIFHFISGKLEFATTLQLELFMQGFQRTRCFNNQREERRKKGPCTQGAYIQETARKTEIEEMRVTRGISFLLHNCWRDSKFRNLELTGGGVGCPVAEVCSSTLSKQNCRFLFLVH